MASEEIVALLQRLIGQICAVDPATVHADGQLVGFGLDSVRVLDLLMAVEDELGVEISEGDPALASVKSIRDLAELIEQRQSLL